MKYSLTERFKISKLSLGTAQLGLNYGIANTAGKPNSKQSFNILQTALKAGINCFDTAYSYGNSEDIIGSFISTQINDDSLIIVTKLKPFESDKTDPLKIYAEVENNVRKSANRLKIDKIPFCLLHKASNMVENDGMIVHSLTLLKDEDLIEKIGVSVYMPDEVEQAIDVGEFDAIQIPINVFDQRLIESGLLKDLKRHNFTVFARSVFLQGLFFLKPDNLVNNMKSAKEPLETLKELSEEYKIGIDELALVFVRDLPEISSLVVGAETSVQVLKNCNLIERPELPRQLSCELFDVFSEVPDKILNPTLWTE